MKNIFQLLRLLMLLEILNLVTPVKNKYLTKYILDIMKLFWISKNAMVFVLIKPESFIK
nr:MAG TPA: hypothetical protein [Caudoviricetes sp.]